MAFAIPNAPFISTKRTVRWIMGMVLLTLLPAALVYCNYFGWGLLVQFTLASIAGIACEALALSLRKRTLQPAISDGSTPLYAVFSRLSQQTTKTTTAIVGTAVSRTKAG